MDNRDDNRNSISIRLNSKSFRDVRTIIDKYVWEYKIKKVNEEYHETFVCHSHRTPWYKPENVMLYIRYPYMMAYNYRILESDCEWKAITNINKVTTKSMIDKNGHDVYKSVQYFKSNNSEQLVDVPRLYYYSSGAFNLKK